MRRYTLEIKGRKGATLATKIKRANNTGSLVGLSRDMIAEDNRIKSIEIRDMMGNLLQVVK